MSSAERSHAHAEIRAIVVSSLDDEQQTTTVLVPTHQELNSSEEEKKGLPTHWAANEPKPKSHRCCFGQYFCCGLCACECQKYDKRWSDKERLAKMYYRWLRLSGWSLLRWPQKERDKKEKTDDALKPLPTSVKARIFDVFWLFVVILALAGNCYYGWRYARKHSGAEKQSWDWRRHSQKALANSTMCLSNDGSYYCHRRKIPAYEWSAVALGRWHTIVPLAWFLAQGVYLRQKQVLKLLSEMNTVTMTDFVLGRILKVHRNHAWVYPLTAAYSVANAALVALAFFDQCDCQRKYNDLHKVIDYYFVAAKICSVLIIPLLVSTNCMLFLWVSEILKSQYKELVSAVAMQHKSGSERILKRFLPAIFLLWTDHPPALTFEEYDAWLQSNASVIPLRTEVLEKYSSPPLIPSLKTTVSPSLLISPSEIAIGGSGHSHSAMKAPLLADTSERSNSWLCGCEGFYESKATLSFCVESERFRLNSVSARAKTKRNAERKGFKDAEWKKRLDSWTMDGSDKFLAKHNQILRRVDSASRVYEILLLPALVGYLSAIAICLVTLLFLWFFPQAPWGWLQRTENAMTLIVHIGGFLFAYATIKSLNDVANDTANDIVKYQWFGAAQRTHLLTQLPFVPIAFRLPTVGVHLTASKMKFILRIVVTVVITPLLRLLSENV